MSLSKQCFAANVDPAANMHMQGYMSSNTQAYIQNSVDNNPATSAHLDGAGAFSDWKTWLDSIDSNLEMAIISQRVLGAELAATSETFSYKTRMTAAAVVYNGRSASGQHHAMPELSLS